MKRTKVESSSIASVGYDSDSKILEVEFVRSGPTPSIYEFRENGPGADLGGAYLTMMAPGVSIGSSFHRLVRSNPDVISTKTDKPA